MVFAGSIAILLSKYKAYFHNKKRSSNILNNNFKTNENMNKKTPRGRQRSISRVVLIFKLFW